MRHCSPRSLQTHEQTLSIYFYGLPPTACESKASAKKTNPQMCTYVYLVAISVMPVAT